MAFAQHILATTDFSPASEKGVRAAAEVAVLTGAGITLVHVFDPAPFAPIATRGEELASQLVDEQQLERSIRDALEAVRGNLLAGVKDVSLEVIQSANAADAISKRADGADVDLIVMSTHGRTGLAHLLIGSVAERVVRHARCAVLTVHSFVD